MDKPSARLYFVLWWCLPMANPLAMVVPLPACLLFHMPSCLLDWASCGQRFLQLSGLGMIILLQRESSHPYNP